MGWAAAHAADSRNGRWGSEDLVVLTYEVRFTLVISTGRRNTLS